MAGVLDLDRIVHGLEHGLGDFRHGERRSGGGSQVPLLYQVLDPERFTVAFEPGSVAWQVLSNDQNRFSPPRSLPPILDLELPEDVDNPTGAWVIARYAYSEGAFKLLEDVLAQGHVFGMNGFLEFAWSLARALAFLHEHGIVHGQWNSKSVIAVPTDEMAHPLLEVSNHRFEIINTGVCFRDKRAIPAEYLELGYYPPEAFLSEAGGPDYGALDLVGDVYCFAAFLKDLMQRSCSSEELPSQARRILEELQKEANRRGWKAAPESLRRKEMEILDHLYTIRVRSESLIQEALQPREERCTAARVLEVVEDLHAKAISYLEELFGKGFEPVNAFGDGLQHYTTFQLEVSPSEINSYEDSRVVLTGRGLPHELVRVTLNETHQGVRVLSARPGRIEFLVERGFRSGQYRVSVNNRRTNGTLEVFSSAWNAIDPSEIHQPWEGFGNIRLFVRGERLPKDAEFCLQSAGGADKVAAVVVLPAPIESGTEDALQLTFPCDTAPGDYELVANGRPTGLRTTVLGQLPDPVVNADGLVPDEVKNHRSWSLRLTGRNLHPLMVVDFGEETPAGMRVCVINDGEAELEIPGRFPPGDYPLRLNFRETGARLRVIAPRWSGIDPASVKLLRRGKAPLRFRIAGESLPQPCEETPYSLRGRGTSAGDVTAEEIKPGSVHLLRVEPRLPRGRCSLRFGDLDTGLTLRVRRQMSRAVVTALWLVTATLVGSGGLAVKNAIEPRIDRVEPAETYAFGEPAVTLSGRYLAAVQLLDGDGRQIAEYPVHELPETGGYGFVPGETPPGRYRLRPVGALFGGTASEHELTLLSPDFRLEPAVVHRLVDTEVRLGADAGFDLSRVATLSLHDRETGRLLVRLPVSGGRLAVPPGRLPPGTYPVSLDGQKPTDPLQLEVVGPVVADVSPNPVSRDSEGSFLISVTGAQLGPASLFLMDPASGQTHGLEPGEDRRYRSTAPPGEYVVAAAAADDPPEAVSELVVTVLPTPVVAAVAPRKLDPGVVTEVTFSGTNLAALERLVLRPLDGDAPGVEVPLDPERMAPDGTFRAEVTLASGTWRVSPADGELTVDVFADCSQALADYAVSGEVDALLQCLEEGRPPADVIRGAAGLLFDRGMFDEARALYADSPDLLARFRTAFIDAFLQGRNVPVLTPRDEDQGSAYAVAAARLGWSGVRWREFSAATLPWELEYVLGLTSSDVETAAAAFQRSIDKKTSASAGFEAVPFEPAAVALAHARVELAVQLIGKVEIPRARGLLSDQLIGDPDAWGHLDPGDRSLALFWYGHLLLWYDGDQEAAAAVFGQGQDLEGSPAQWMRQYLTALGGPPGGEVAGTDPGWEPTFVRVFQLYREALRSPNYNLLAAGQDTGSYLSRQERETSAELRGLVETLEGLEPADPFAHWALLYGLRNAQRISWPAQTGSRLAEQHRARLLGVALPAELEPVRQAYLIFGELEPYDYSQVTTLTRSERSELAERIGGLQGLDLPQPLRDSVEQLGKRFLDPSVVWWRQIRK